METTLEHFDQKCKTLVEKNKALKALEREVKDLRADVLATLLSRDEDSRTYKAAGATIYVRDMAIVTVPKERELKFKMFNWIKERAPDWYTANVTFNHRSLTSFYEAEEKAANERGEEFEGIPGAICDMRQTLGIRGG